MTQQKCNNNSSYQYVVFACLFACSNYANGVSQFVHDKKAHLKKSTLQTCSCFLGFSSMGLNDEFTLFFYASFSIFGPLRRPQGQNSGRSRSLASLQIMFNLQSPQIINLNHQKITYFRHYVPWTKIPYQYLAHVIKTTKFTNSESPIFCLLA